MTPVMPCPLKIPIVKFPLYEDLKKMGPYKFQFKMTILTSSTNKNRFMALLAAPVAFWDAIQRINPNARMPTSVNPGFCVFAFVVVSPPVTVAIMLSPP